MTRFAHTPILVAGSCLLTGSVVSCLLRAGHRVVLYSDDCPAVEQRVALLATETRPDWPVRGTLVCQPLTGWEGLPVPDKTRPCDLAIVLTAEDEALKQDRIRQLETLLPADALIAVNTESIPLDALQQNARQPERILGVNWSEPAHTTRFLEVITTDCNRPDWVEAFCQVARGQWQKDPYVLRHGQGIRTRLLCALIREAFYLIENQYVSVEDIDRACRNDAGYYLPFAGNFRYMDLMGTYVYGLVMRDLNPELTKNRHVPAFFSDLIQQGGQGMANGRGFYAYGPAESDTWDAQFRQFSQQIAELMQQYPFHYAAPPAAAKIHP